MKESRSHHFTCCLQGMFLDNHSERKLRPDFESLCTKRKKRRGKGAAYTCVKANLALHKVIGKENFIQGYFNRGESPRNLRSTPPKGKVRGLHFVYFLFLFFLSCSLSLPLLFFFILIF